jgi:hypothetical protein
VVIKDARFRKGHIVTIDDIPVLLSLGKDTSLSGKAGGHAARERGGRSPLLPLYKRAYYSLSAQRRKNHSLCATDGLLKVASRGLMR